MGVVNSVEKINDQIINRPIDYSCGKTIEDEELLKQIQQIAIQMNTELYTKRLIKNQDKLQPLETTGVNKWKKMLEFNRMMILQQPVNQKYHQKEYSNPPIHTLKVLNLIKKLPSTDHRSRKKKIYRSN